MANQTTGFKILWPVDPFAEEPRLQRSAAMAIRWLTKNRPGSEVQPCHVANDYSSILPNTTRRHYLEKISIFTKDFVQDLLKRVKLPKPQPLMVISEDFSSTHAAVESLLSFAENKAFDLIVASTRARRVSRSEMSLPGSFVEALMQHATLPVFAVNPEWRHFVNYKRIVFPTDFSRESKECFEYAIELAKAFNMKLMLFSKASIPLSLPSRALTQLVPEVRDVLSNKVKTAHWEAKKWVQYAKRKGVVVNVSVNSMHGQSYFDAFLAHLMKSPGIPVIAPPLSTQVSANAIHTLIRKTRSPVWYIPTNLRVGVTVKEAAEHLRRAA